MYCSLCVAPYETIYVFREESQGLVPQAEAEDLIVSMYNWVAPLGDTRGPRLNWMILLNPDNYSEFCKMAVLRTKCCTLQHILRF